MFPNKKWALRGDTPFAHPLTLHGQLRMADFYLLLILFATDMRNGEEI